MNTVSSVVSSGLCCGCGACSGVCPASSIRMGFNRTGEYNPYPANSECTGCGLCMKVCPCSTESKDKNEIGTDLYGSIPNIRYENETGFFIRAYSGYSTVHRREAASGGLATWLMESLLANNMVDAVFCVKPGAGEHPLFAFKPCSTPEDIRECSGSCYYPVELSSVIRTMLEKDGRYVVIALPCACRALRLAAQKVPRLGKRLKFVIGLTCGHTASSFFSEYICALAGTDPGQLDGIRFRIKTPSVPVSDYNTGIRYRTTHGDESRNIHWSQGVWGAFMNRFFTPLACDFCDDVFAECSDVSFMDAWLPEYAGDASGNGIMLIRNPDIEGLVEKARGRDQVMNPIDIGRVIQSQTSALTTKRTWLPERIRIAAKCRQAPMKRLFDRHKAGVPYFERLIIRAQWDMARSSGRLWMESDHDLERFNRMSVSIRNRLKWANRLAALSSDPIAAIGNWRIKLTDMAKGNWRIFNILSKPHRGLQNEPAKIKR